MQGHENGDITHFMCKRQEDKIDIMFYVVFVSTYLLCTQQEKI